MEDEIFVSSVSPNKKFGSVFEHSDVGYFYLMDLSKPKRQQIIGSIRISSEELDFQEVDVRLLWSMDSISAGLSIRDYLWAVFVGPDTRYGGDYKSGKLPDIPKHLIEEFRGK